jgi:hypothetical protein
MYNEIEPLQECLNTLKPKKRGLLINLTPYTLPKVTGMLHTPNEPLELVFQKF